MPPQLVAREGILEQFAEAIKDGAGAPGLLTIVAGPRGVGKTAALTTMGSVAESAGWLTVSETATPGFLIRIHSQLISLIEQSTAGVPRGADPSASTVDIDEPALSLGFRSPQWRNTAITLLTFLEARGTGLLITVDDIRSDDRAELAQLAADVQHLIRDTLPIALVLAGTPDAVAALLNEEVCAFLRRAQRIDLGPIPIAEAFTTPQ